MKKMISLAAILCMLLCLAGCGGDGGAQNMEDSSPENGGAVFTYNETRIAMKAPAEPVLAALGDPKSYTEETSCAFEGLDKTYYYGSFYLTTYPGEGGDYICRLWFADDSVATEEGITIGSAQAEVEHAYGADSFNGSTAYTIREGETKLTVIITDGLVSSVLYEAVFE